MRVRGLNGAALLEILLRSKPNYLAGGKYCSKCEYYVITSELFCKCCGMRLRASPAAREYKEKVRTKKKLVAVI
jgi:hypothetical protein